MATYMLYQILVKYDKEKYLSRFESDVFDYDCTKCASQYELNSFVTMAAYWLPDLPSIKGSSSPLWHSILILANGASYA